MLGDSEAALLEEEKQLMEEERMLADRLKACLLYLLPKHQKLVEAIGSASRSGPVTPTKPVAGLML